MLTENNTPMVHMFELHGLRLALDVESNTLHILDEPAWLALSRLKDGADREEVLRELGLAFGGRTAAAVMQEIDELRGRGLLFGAPALVPQGNEDVVKALCLHLSHDCNMRCSYCFAGTGHYGGKRSLMPEQVARAAVDFLLRESKGRRHCEIDFFGGEPLLNLEVLKKTVAYGRERAGELGKILKFTVTTNCLELGEAERAYLNAENISLVLSLDGRKEVHDRLRRLPDGSGSFDLVLPNALRLVRERDGDNYYLRGTYTGYNTDFDADAEAMIALGFKRISLEPAVLPPEHAAALSERHLAVLYAGYERLARQLWQMETRGERVYFFHFELDLKQGPCVRKRSAGCGAGTAYLAVSPDGTLYPCHQFVGLAEFAAGHVTAGRNAAVLAPFGQVGPDRKEACRSCFARYFCGGGCHAAAWLQNGRLEEPYRLGCLLHRKRVECGLYLQAMRMLSQVR